MKFAAVLAAAFLGQTYAFVPHKLSHNELRQPTAVTQSVFEEALTQVGVLSVSDIPQFAELREQMLAASGKCSLKTKGSRTEGKYVFPDGTSRLTLSSTTVNGKAAEISGADMTSPACIEFNALQSKFRDVVDETMNLFVDNLDALQGDSSARKLMLDTENNQHFASVADVVNAGTQLEHFHTYEKFESKGEQPTMDLHTDQGLFIALSPALNLIGGDESHGFKIQLASGEIVEPDFGPNNNELVFMIGDGFSQWLNPNLNVELRATPHQMTMPEAATGAAVRSWYGRMVLPKDTAFLESHGKTYGELKADYANEDKAEELTLGACSTGNVLNGRLLQTCSEGFAYCWHTCLPIPDNCGNNTPTCVFPNGDLCPDGHGCSLTC